MRAHRSTLERMPLGTDEIAPEADLSQMMARRWRSSAVAERTAALEIVHSATGQAESSLSDGLFFKKGFATAEGFRPSYWVYERPSEDQTLANDPVALQPAPKPQRSAEEPVIPLASMPNLLLPDETGEADEDESAEPVAAANAGIEPEADLSKIVIRRTPFLRSADCDPAIAPAIEAATKAPLLEPLRSVDMVAAAMARKAALAQAAAVPAAEAFHPETDARAPALVAPPPAPPAARAEPAPVVAPPARDPATPSPTTAPGTDGLVVAQLTQVIESVLSSKSYSSQQDAAALRTARERPDARQKGGKAAQANARLPATAPAGADGRAASSKPKDAHVVLAAVWRIGRVSALAILVTLLAEYFLNAWLAGG